MGWCSARYELVLGKASAMHGFVPSEEHMLKVVICIRYSHLFCFYLPSISYLVANAENEVECMELFPAFIKISSIQSSSLILVYRLVLSFQQ